MNAFIDCAGAGPERADSRAGAQLSIEKSSPLVVVLGPDVNVFYEHE